MVSTLFYLDSQHIKVKLVSIYIKFDSTPLNFPLNPLCPVYVKNFGYFHQKTIKILHFREIQILLNNGGSTLPKNIPCNNRQNCSWECLQNFVKSKGNSYNILK